MSSVSASEATLAKEAPSLLELWNSNNGNSELDIFTPSSEKFKQLTTWINMGTVELPLAIIQPHNETAVQTTVRFCVARKIPFSIKSGSRSMGGSSAIGAPGVVIDLGLLTTVEVTKFDHPVGPQAYSGIAKVGGRILGGDLTKALHEQGLTTPTAWLVELSMTADVSPVWNPLRKCKYSASVFPFLSIALYELVLRFRTAQIYT